MTQQRFLEQLLKLLSDNKSFPKCQHERRVDLFINFFLPEILDAEFGAPIDLVIPEFPLKKESTAHTTNADYFAYSSKRNRVYLCEFKTAVESFDQEQLERYFQAKDDGWSKVIKDISTVFESTEPRHKAKYAKLIEKVQDIPTEVDIEVIYIAPEATRSKIDAFISRSGFSFLSLESFANLRIDTPFAEEWNLVRSNLQ